MASKQEVLFAETIIAMKKAKKRRAYESDDDSEIDQPINRGQKLKRRARFVHEGQLAPPSGPEYYREIVDHGGYQRAIISRKPPLVDDDGYEVDSEDEDDDERLQEALRSATDLDPYATVRLENILAPLTAVTELPAHPTLSRSYTSEILTDLTKQGCDIVHKENASLWKVKNLLTKLIGDHIWVPCELMEGPNDLEFYRDDYVESEQAKLSGKSNNANGHVSTRPGDGSSSATNGEASLNGAAANHNNTDIAMPDVDVGHVSTDKQQNSQGNEENPGDDNTDLTKESKAPRDGQATPERTNRENGQNTNGGRQEGSTGGASSAIQRANAEEGTSRPMSMTPDSADQPAIHPLFLAPKTAMPDRDMALPQDEAADLRHLLQLYVQKQEEVCRGARRLHEGLLQAERMRKTVFQWSKYEAHSGTMRDMSDGEDWYDKEEWDLADDLKKGQDEEEEESAQAQPAKKTRARRPRL